jgi:hypothetical protein
MRVEENHPWEVLIDVTQSAYGDRQEDDGIRPIRVYLTIMPNLHSVCLVEGTIRLRSTGGGYSVSVPLNTILVVYYESMKRKLKIKPIYECRCNGRLQTKRFTRLAHTGSHTLFINHFFSGCV